jgi:hypothetical protein
MKLVMTLLVRDHAEIIDANISFHLNAGVDFIVVTDNRSVDGTTDILESYAREGVVHLIREPSETFRQDEWITRMARLAAAEFSADWVINADTDEFWWPRGESLKSVLAEIPERYGVVRALWRHFPPRPDDGRFFAERMTVRMAPHVAVTSPLSQYVANAESEKSAHRADPTVCRRDKNLFTTSGRRLVPLRGWYPIEVLHFPLRTEEQCLRKYRSHVQAGPPLAYQERAVDAFEGGRMQEFYSSLVVGDATLARGVNDGSLVIDTRLRDALRALRVEGGQHPFALPGGDQKPLSFPKPDLVEEMIYAADAALLDEATVVRLQARLDRIEAELNSLRLTRRAKLRWKIAHLLGRR